MNIRRKKKIFLGGLFMFILLALFLLIVLRENNRFLVISSREVLRSLPYATWAPIDQADARKSGVTKYIKNLTADGINVYCSASNNKARFMDMTGDELHIISPENTPGCKLIKPYRGNEFLLLVGDTKIMKINWDSEAQWERGEWFHHDFDVDERGDIYVLTNKASYIPEINADNLILDNLISVLSPEGTLNKEFSFAKMIVANNTQPILSLARNCKFIHKTGCNEVFDVNSLQIIDRDIVLGPKRIFKKGDVLFSMKSLNLVGVVDLEKEKIIWFWGHGELDAQHNATILKNGNILIFDNGRRRRKYSRVIELNPKTAQIVWQYKANPPKQFHSGSRGAAQRLSNGNTLITESDMGHVFEVTPSGKIVWEFWNIDKRKDKNERSTIYRMTRYDYSILRTHGGETEAINFQQRE